MKELENQQPSSCRTKRFPGLVLGIVQLIEEVDISKHRWKVKCLKCGRIFEVSNGTLTSYKNGTRTRCGGCPIERKSKYKIGDKYAGI